jgi:hypothetical protein
MARQLLDINNELEMAREIQLFILTHEIPETRGLEIAARYVPTSSVAGDFCDIIIVDENQCGDSGRGRLRARPADFVTLYIPNILPPPPYRFTDRGHRESFSPSGYCRTAQNFRNEKGQNFRNR